MLASETMQNRHVAVLPSPGMGHIIPLLELAKRLVINHGFHVSFLVITTGASAAQNQLLKSPSLPHGLHVVDLPPSDVSNIVHHNMPVVTRRALIVQESLNRSLKPVLMELINRPQALIIDIFTTDAFEICQELLIPIYSFFTTSAAILAFSLYLPTLDREVECEYKDLPGPVLVPGCRPERTIDLVNAVQNRKIDEYKWFLLHVSRLPLSAGILLNTWEDLEPATLHALRENGFYKEILTPPIYPIGPLIKEDDLGNECEDECLNWLDKQPSDSVIFVSFGSGGTLSAEQLTELAYGLELSQQRFIWVVRKPTDESASGAYFNVGNDANNDHVFSYLPEGFLKRTQGVGMVVPSWAPQVAVLSHASTGGFLSHCGWNSTLESMMHGVPIIAWPLYAEQRMNATMLVDQIGVALRPVAEPGKGVVKREEIEKVVRLVMEGEEGKVIRSRVKELKESAHKALNNGGSSYDTLALVANKWASTNGETPAQHI